MRHEGEIPLGQRRLERADEGLHLRRHERKNLHPVHGNGARLGTGERFIFTRVEVKKTFFVLFRRRRDNTRRHRVREDPARRVVGLLHEPRLRVAIDEQNLRVQIPRQRARHIKRIRIGATRHLEIEGRRGRGQAQTRGDAHGQRREAFGVRKRRGDNRPHALVRDLFHSLAREVEQRPPSVAQGERDLLDPHARRFDHLKSRCCRGRGSCGASSRGRRRESPRPSCPRPAREPSRGSRRDPRVSVWRGVSRRRGCRSPTSRAN